MFNSSIKSKFATLFALSTVLASSITYSPVLSAPAILDTAETEAETSIAKQRSCTSVRDVLDNIVSFDGQQNFKEVPDSRCLNFGTGDFTISAWIKTTSTSGIEVIVDKRIETSGPVQGYALVNYNGKLLFQLADGGQGKEWYNYESEIPIADGQWHHVAVSVERDQKDGGHWYLDGVETGTRFDPTKRPGSVDNTKPLTIGRRSDSSNPGFFRGDIGFVRVFKGVRTFKQ